MKYLRFDAKGELSARYDSEVHGDAIPEDAMEVDDDTFLRTIVETDGIWSLAGEQVHKKPFPRPSQAVIVGQTLALARTFMDQVATSYGFAHMADAVTYAEEPAVPELQQQGQALRAWRSLIMAKSLAFGEAWSETHDTLPTANDVISALPAFAFPGA